MEDNSSSKRAVGLKGDTEQTRHEAIRADLEREEVWDGCSAGPSSLGGHPEASVCLLSPYLPRSSSDYIQGTGAALNDQTFSVLRISTLSIRDTENGGGRH